MSTLTLHSSTQAGTLPYLATVFPLEGAVPSGQTVISTDDPSLGASILSRWPDGSAQVVVLAGETAVAASASRAIGLISGTKPAPPLTASKVSEIVSQIACNFGAAGSASLSSFGSPERIWWANDRVICCRYRLPIGGDGLEAVIDVHAFAGGRALVEVVIENGKIDANATTPVAPSTKSYTNATIAVNGSLIATVSSPTAGTPFPNQRNNNGGGSYAGGHEAFRAWYCSARIDGGTVTALTTAAQQAGPFGIEVTHDAASLQAHPWFFKPAPFASVVNYQTQYSQTYDTYVPWATCRLRVPGMGGTGGDQQIGMVSHEQSDYIIGGSKYARRAVLATGTAQLCFQWNNRHSGTGEFNGQVPARQQYARRAPAQWPMPNVEPNYGGSQNDASHCPASPLVPFLCRPSPMYIEMAQRAAAWCYVNFSGGSWYSSFPGGFHNYDQPRSRAWRVRNYAICSWLTPDADTNRKAGYRDTLTAYAAGLQKYLDRSFNALGVLWADGPGPTPETDGGLAGRAGDGQPYLEANFMHMFCVMAFNTVARLKLLTGAPQAQWESVARAFGAIPVRRINDARGGEWRVQAIDYPVGIQVGNSGVMTLNQLDGTFGACMRAYYSAGTLPPSAGTWLSSGGGLGARNWDTAGLTYEAGPAGYEFADEFYCALVTSVENGVPGADAAWTKLYGTAGNGDLTNFNAWAQSKFSISSAWNRFPRNK